MTKIEWTDETWNPTVGCSRVSAGCENCYAERFASRGISASHEGLTVTGEKGPRWTGEVRLFPERLSQPLHWRRPRRIFVDSMSDLFHEKVPNEFIASVWNVMRATPQHTYQILTKRPERMASVVPRLRFDGSADGGKGRVWVAESADAGGYPLAHGHRGSTGLLNVQLGTSVENQETADERISHLLATPAAVLFLSCEPLLESINLSVALEGTDYEFLPPRKPIGWCVTGGESGPGARPCDVEWIRSIKDQCQAANTPCFVKQLGARPIHWCVGRLYSGPNELYPLDYCDAYDSGEAGRCRGKCFLLKNRKGADPREWPMDLRVQQLPGEGSRC